LKDLQEIEISQGNFCTAQGALFPDQEKVVQGRGGEIDARARPYSDVLDSKLFNGTRGQGDSLLSGNSCYKASLLQTINKRQRRLHTHIFILIYGREGKALP